MEDSRILYERRLIELFKDNIEDEKKRLVLISQIINDTDKMCRGLLSLNFNNQIYFIHTLFIENDVQKSKNYLYKIGMVNAYYHEILKMEIFEMLKTFTFPILSDSPKLIERYLTYHKAGYYDSFTTHFAKGVQSILKDDMLALEKHIDGLRRRSKRGDAKLFTGVITSFEGFYNNDSEGIISGIYEILKKTKRQYPNLLDYQYIHYEATAIAKLAWRKGMEIEIDNPLVPKELLPVRELEHYEGYDFFKELEKD